MMIFQFRAMSDEQEDFLLDVEVRHDMNLLDFSNFLGQELGYDLSMITSIFTSDSEWEKLQEFTSFDMGATGDDIQFELCDDCDGPIAMERVKLDDIVIEKFDRLLYVFDPLHERQLYIELLRTLKIDTQLTYPRVLERLGDAPVQLLDV